MREASSSHIKIVQTLAQMSDQTLDQTLDSIFAQTFANSMKFMIYYCHYERIYRMFMNLKISSFFQVKMKKVWKILKELNYWRKNCAKWFAKVILIYYDFLIFPIPPFPASSYKRFFTICFRIVRMGSRKTFKIWGWTIWEFAI